MSTITISGGNTFVVLWVTNHHGDIFNLTITGGNTANNGGGIDLTTNGAQGSNVTVTNCTISNNTSTALGGGICVDFYGELTVVNSTIDGNTASGGGGIMNKDGTLVVSGSTIANNTATAAGTSWHYPVFSGGGGIYNNGPFGSTPGSTTKGITNISNSTITDNTSPAGGGLYVNGGIVTVTNSTIAYNNVTDPPGYDGGGIFTYNQISNTNPGYTSISDAIVNNTIVVDNTINSGTPDDLAGSWIAGSYNLVGTDVAGFLTSSTGNQIGVTNPGLGTLESNGGPTQTIALLAGSPAIGAGSVALAVGADGSPLTTDQTGRPRLTNGNVDIGDFEFNSTPTSPTVPTNLVAAANNGSVTLNWTASAGAASYNVYRSTTSRTESSTPYQTGIAATSFTDTGLTNGTTYYYEVTAVNAVGESNKSSEVSATPSQIQLVSAIDAGGGAAGSYLTDSGFTGGATASTTIINTSKVANPAPQAVYQTERFGNFTYTASGLTAGATPRFNCNLLRSTGPRLVIGSSMC